MNADYWVDSAAESDHKRGGGCSRKRIRWANRSKLRRRAAVVVVVVRWRHRCRRVVESRAGRRKIESEERERVVDRRETISDGAEQRNVAKTRGSSGTWDEGKADGRRVRVGDKQKQEEKKE
jgi:hypothetical protein